MTTNLALRRLLPFGLAPLLALLLWPAMARADVQPDQVPADLKTAIEQKVKADGHQYAGLCRAIDQPSNVGKHCAFVLALTATTAEVSYGPVLSEPVAKVNFSKVNGAWVVAVPGQPAAVPTELRAAIKTHVESKGHAYAGLCTEIAQDGSNIGKYCAAVTNLTATTASVSYGPVASDAITTVTFEKRTSGWSATSGAAPTVVAPRPPATGNTQTSDETFDITAPSLLIGLLLAGLFGVLSTQARRRTGGAK